MWQIFKQKILTIKQVAGLEIVFLPNDKLLLNLVLLTVKKGVVNKVLEQYHLETIADLKNKITTDIPLALVLNGKGILQKRIEGILTTQQNFDFSSILPNINPTDFFYQFDSYSNFTIISLARKDAIENILKQLTIQGFKVLSTTLSFKNITPLLDLLPNSKNLIIDTSTNTLILERNEINNYTIAEPTRFNDTKATEFNIGNQYIKSNGLLSYGAALTLLINPIESIEESGFSTVARDREEFKNYLLFKAASIGLLGFIFFILLINFFLYNHFFSANNYLRSTSQSTVEQVDKSKALSNELSLKENFIQNSGWQKNSKLSFFADRIAAAVPDEVTLTSLNVHPISSSVFSETGTFNFKKDTILITGTCENPLQLNYFVDKIKSIREIKKTAIKNYSNKKENEGGIFSLELITD